MVSLLRHNSSLIASFAFSFPSQRRTPRNATRQESLISVTPGRAMLRDPARPPVPHGVAGGGAAHTMNA